MIDSKLWGPCTWYVIHEIAFSLPQNNIKLSINTSKNLLTFYKGIQQLIPCPACKTHYKTILSKHPVDKNNKFGVNISKWTVTIHNITNKGLNKKVITYNDAKKIYLRKGAIGVNHKKISEFVKYILEKNSNNVSLQVRKSVLLSLIELYPCKKCITYLQKYLSEKTLDNVTNNNEMNNWITDLRLVIEKGCS